MADEENRQEQRIEAIWCVDSSTGEQVLIDIYSKEILARKDDKGNIICEL